MDGYFCRNALGWVPIVGVEVRQGIYRVFMSVFIVAYMATAVASHNKKTTLGGAIYRELRWMHTTLCFWQNWAMFAPPPGSTSWLFFQGVTEDGETIDLEPLVQPVEQPYFKFRYDRLQKLTLSSYQKSRKPLRKSIARYVCDRAEKDGTPLKSVTLIRDRTWALRPSQRWKNPDRERRHKVTEVGEFKCR